MAYTQLTMKSRGFLETKRRDAWWLMPAVTFVVFGSFIVYSTWAAFQGANYSWGPYLSPFYSPEIFGDSPHALLGKIPSWIPAWIPFSPAFLILWAPGGFRFTCYYYRGAYYKAFWGDPPACTVGELRTGYRGEKKLPLIMQNIHRYFLYLALAFLLFLAYDVWRALWFPDGAGHEKFGLGVGTLVLAVNVILLGSYTFSCHSLRHLVGGRKDKLSDSPFCQKAFACTSAMNKKHMLFAWLSLFWVGFSDIYVRLCATNVIHDFRIF
ncbi:MAG: succinate dehydrogenase [Pyrinomonadaceae bacterium]